MFLLVNLTRNKESIFLRGVEIVTFNPETEVYTRRFQIQQPRLGDFNNVWCRVPETFTKESLPFH